MNSESKQDQLADLILEVIPKLMQSIREEMRGQRTNQLTVPQFRILAAINRGITHNKELCDLLGVSEAATSKMVESLVIKKLIKKEKSTIDRRQTTLTLTTSGLKLFKTIKLNAKTQLALKIGKLTPSKIDLILTGITEIKNAPTLVNISKGYTSNPNASI